MDTLSANAAAVRRHREKNPESVRAMNLWRLYRLRPEQYDAMLIAQDYRCALCGIHERDVDTSKVGGRPRNDGKPRATVALSVDHDHACCNGPRSCGACVRALLCPPCNVIVGSFRDDVARMEMALAYVVHHRNHTVSSTD